ncbi:uncharacterized protein TrAtP1_012479 [Trichoderma atroviride]|uniref:Uncharacterized protein n=1 Tax=Hypocrea atroviridis (strain ATCC 20476 / IMI 206040) TaxID=452589 RepID=G9NPE5_HYPAI|nr:uncharacterized protein TRIATDRAFT_298556 [Trichoderma atroviride IMI 206040]EHK47416.1 hypothetical protein TRIATDRAFT_298556 [Trichoderma atroviride IMI 206040]UKZ71526.1 hypothetical protein TrAtP1_012479 [Trichoderma atroviride]
MSPPHLIAASGGGCHFQCHIATCESKDDSSVTGRNRTSWARGTPFGNKDRAAEFYSAVVSISEWLCPASLDHRLHQYGMECIRGKRQKATAHIERVLRLGMRTSCFVGRHLSRSPIHLSTEGEAEKRLESCWVHRYSIAFSFQICSITRPASLAPWRVCH